MHMFSQEEMEKVSFPDYNVDKMEYFPEKKIIRIFVDGAWVTTGFREGYELGKGVLFFNDWESLTVKRYHKDVDKDVEEIPNETLADLCEVIFSDSNAILRGFSKKVRHWMEWKIVNVKMHAEFEDYVEDLDWKPKTSR